MQPKTGPVSPCFRPRFTVVVAPFHRSEVENGRKYRPRFTVAKLSKLQAFAEMAAADG